MKKKLSIAAAILAVVGIMTAFVILVAVPSLKNAEIKSAKKELFESYYTFPENGVLTAKNGFDGKDKNSLVYVKAAVQQEADCVEVDIIFNDDGVPYIAESKKNITSKTMPLEYLISYFSEEADKESDDIEVRRHKINMHIVEAENISVIEKIASEYNMTDYVFFTGVNINQAVYVSSQCSQIGFYLDYKLDKLKSNEPEYIDKVFNDICTAGAIGINCTVDGFSEGLQNVLKENWMKISFKDVNSEIDMCKALKYSPDEIITDSPETLREILYEWNTNAPESDIISQ